MSNERTAISALYRIRPAADHQRMFVNPAALHLEHEDNGPVP